MAATTIYFAQGFKRTDGKWVLRFVDDDGDVVYDCEIDELGIIGPLITKAIASATADMLAIHHAVNATLKQELDRRAKEKR